MLVYRLTVFNLLFFRLLGGAFCWQLVYPHPVSCFPAAPLLQPIIGQQKTRWGQKLSTKDQKRPKMINKWPEEAKMVNNWPEVVIHGQQNRRRKKKRSKTLQNKRAILSQTPNGSGPVCLSLRRRGRGERRKWAHSTAHSSGLQVWCGHPQCQQRCRCGHPQCQQRWTPTAMVVPKQRVGSKPSAV